MFTKPQSSAKKDKNKNSSPLKQSETNSKQGRNQNFLDRNEDVKIVGDCAELQQQNNNPLMLMKPASLFMHNSIESIGERS